MPTIAEQKTIRQSTVNSLGIASLVLVSTSFLISIANTSVMIDQQKDKNSLVGWGAFSLIFIAVTLVVFIVAWLKGAYSLVACGFREAGYNVIADEPVKTYTKQTSQEQYGGTFDLFDDEGDLFG